MAEKTEQGRDEAPRDEAALSAARQMVYDVFSTLGIEYEVASHPPINSAADRLLQRVEVDALICKNLFLCNKDKSRYYLYTLPIDKRANLTALAQTLGETRFSFGGADALWDRLGITPGSVSLLNIIGACERSESRDITNVKFIVDNDALDVPRIGLHPNDNAATIMFAADRLPEIFGYYGLEFSFVKA